MSPESSKPETVKPERLPRWLRTRFDGGRSRQEVRDLLRELRLHTVCESARCPNVCACWQRHAAAFLLLGNVCTRSCRFCAVGQGSPLPPDSGEPARVVEAVRRLGLRFAVLTCVTRDDLADGGAGHIAAVVRALRQALPQVGIEVLISDFGGRLEGVDEVLAAAPDVLNHHLETTAELTPRIRSHADYRRSLAVLARAAAAHAAGVARAQVKSGLMLGLGETAAGIRAALADLRRSGVTILTLGQYLPPSAQHWPLARYVPPPEFEEWRRVALAEYGFTTVVSGPLVRSSYLAEEAAAGGACTTVPRALTEETPA